MPGIGDFLQAFAKNFTPRAANIFGQLSQQAIGGQEGYAQQQMNERQKAQLAAQLQMHNSMTPYEQAQVARGKTQDSAAETQRQFEDLFRVNQGIAQGQFGIAPVGTPGAMATPGNGPSIIPTPTQKHTILKDSALGKDLQLDTDLKDITSEDFLHYVTPFFEKKQLAEAKAKEEAELRASLGSIKGDLIEQAKARFSPAYYEGIYGKGNVDPEAANHLKTKLAQLEAAFNEDQRSKVSTRMTAFPKELDSFQSPWERKLLADQAKKDATDAAKAAKDFGQNVIVPSADGKTPGKLMRIYPGQAMPTGAITMAGENKMNTPTAQMQARGEMAKTVSVMVPKIVSQVDALANKIGPASGRWNEAWVNKAGMDDPQFAKLDQDLKMFATGVVVTHFGMRGGQDIRKALEKDFGEAQSPEDLKARLLGVDDWLQGYAKAKGLHVPDPETLDMTDAVREQLGVPMTAGAGGEPDFIVQGGKVIPNPKKGRK